MVSSFGVYWFWGGEDGKEGGQARTRPPHPHVVLVRGVDARRREIEKAGVPRRALHLEAGVEEELVLGFEPVVVRLDALHHVLLFIVCFFFWGEGGE